MLLYIKTNLALSAIRLLVYDVQVLRTLNSGIEKTSGTSSYHGSKIFDLNNF